MKPISSKSLLLPSLSLFTSLGTLFCCALPALFVVLGAGAVLAGILSSAPFLIVLSKYKVLLFFFFWNTNGYQWLFYMAKQKSSLSC